MDSESRKKIIGTSIYTIVMVCILLLMFFETLTDRQMISLAGVPSDGFDYFLIHLIDFIVILVSAITLTKYLNSLGYKLMPNRHWHHYYDEKNTYKISKKEQRIRIFLLFLTAVMFYVVITVVVCLSGDCILKS